MPFFRQSLGFHSSQFPPLLGEVDYFNNFWIPVAAGMTGFSLLLRAQILALLILLLGFGLRVIGLPELHLSGDAAWSVYLALKSLPDLTYATAIDSHPPLFYYLLHFWMQAAGLGELPIRMLSAVTGVITVAVTYAIGRRLLGTNGGLLAALLAALSPFLVYFDRMPRMYSLLALLVAIALYLALRLIERPTRMVAGLYMGAMLAALYIHYYAIFPMAAGFVVLSAVWRRQPLRLFGWAGGHAAVLVLFLPWLLYILGPSVSATTQAYGAIDLPRPSSVPALLSRFWVALNVGDMIEAGESRLLTLPVLVVWAGGLTLWLRRFRGGFPRPGLAALWAPITFVALPLIAVLAIFISTPYVPFTRLLLLSAPAYLVLLAWILIEMGKSSRHAAALCTGLTLAVMSYSLTGTYYVERNSSDIEAVEVSQQVIPASGPGDAVIFQALWHAGYFQGRATAETPAARVLGETPLTELRGLVDRTPRLWLSMFTAGKREPQYPHEEWLDRNAYKASESWNGRLRLSLYGGQPDPPLRPVGVEFGEAVRLEAAGLGPEQVRANEVVRLLLKWRALGDLQQKYVGFVHLIDENGRGCTGRDAEPVDGLRPTDGWKAGEIIEDRRGLLIGPGVPAGRYSLALGLYAREDWRQRLVISTGVDRLLFGPVEVLPQIPAPFQAEPVGRAVSLGLDLVEYKLGTGKELHMVRNVDGPVELWLPAKPRAGTRLPVTLRWRSSVPTSEVYRFRLELVDGAGNVWGQAPERLLGDQCPAFRWAPAEVVSETAEVAIRPDALPGAYRLRATLLPPQGPGEIGEPMVFGAVTLEP